MRQIVAILEGIIAKNGEYNSKKLCNLLEYKAFYLYAKWNIKYKIIFIILLQYSYFSLDAINLIEYSGFQIIWPQCLYSAYRKY